MNYPILFQQAIEDVGREYQFGTGQLDSITYLNWKMGVILVKVIDRYEELIRAKLKAEEEATATSEQISPRSQS